MEITCKFKITVQSPDSVYPVASLTSLIRGFHTLLIQNKLHLCPSPIHLLPQFSQFCKKHHLLPICLSQKIRFLIDSWLSLMAHRQSISKPSASSAFKSHLKSDTISFLHHKHHSPSHCPLLPHWSPCLNSYLQSLFSHFTVILLNGNQNKYGLVIEGKGPWSQNAWVQVQTL